MVGCMQARTRRVRVWISRSIGVARPPATKYDGAAMEDVGGQASSPLTGRFGQNFAASDAIVREGEPAERCFILQSGRVRLVRRIRELERSLAVLRPGDLFGEDSLLDKAFHSATAVALTDVAVLALDRSTFGALVSGDAAVATRFAAQLVRRLRSAEEQLENAMLRDHPSRVVNTLLRMAATNAPDEEGAVIDLSPLELSSRVGLDVDAVKNTVQQLSDGGYVKIADEQIVLPDLPALRRLYELLGKKEEVRGDTSV